MKKFEEKDWWLDFASAMLEKTLTLNISKRIKSFSTKSCMHVAHTEG